MLARTTSIIHIRQMNVLSFPKRLGTRNLDGCRSNRFLPSETIGRHCKSWIVDVKVDNLMLRDAPAKLG